MLVGRGTPESRSLEGDGGRTEARNERCRWCRSPWSRPSSHTNESLIQSLARILAAAGADEYDRGGPVGAGRGLGTRAARPTEFLREDSTTGRYAVRSPGFRLFLSIGIVSHHCGDGTPTTECFFKGNMSSATDTMIWDTASVQEGGLKRRA
ncbi:hypothetical protein EVAR_13919_1 [Eumeta japonica]|uniref:Uncharacterized protein n=1 Tax=Eumeta variegata TaxID=151549 RepID=A0A4C1U8J6_EUMVA|nr:hypothetical protein EVAR_13919_1 [Eumeta japonica]